MHVTDWLQILFDQQIDQKSKPFKDNIAEGVKKPHLNVLQF